MRNSTLLAIVNAARHVAAQQLEEAAAGLRPKLPAFLACMALDATHAYLRVFGETSPAASADMGVIRVEPHAGRPAYPQQPAPSSEHGPN